MYVRERKEAYTVQATANMDVPHQEGPSGLERSPHPLPSLLQTKTSMSLDIRSKGLASKGLWYPDEDGRFCLEWLIQVDFITTVYMGSSSQVSETKLSISCAQGASSLERR